MFNIILGYRESMMSTVCVCVCFSLSQITKNNEPDLRPQCIQPWVRSHCSCSFFWKFHMTLLTLFTLKINKLSIFLIPLSIIILSPVSKSYSLTSSFFFYQFFKDYSFQNLQICNYGKGLRGVTAVSYIP